MCDKNGDEGISWKEAKDCGCPEEYKDDFHKAAGSDGIVDEAEFMTECKAQYEGGPSTSGLAQAMRRKRDANSTKKERRGGKK